MDIEIGKQFPGVRRLLALGLLGVIAGGSPLAATGSAELEPLQTLIGEGGQVSALMVRLRDLSILTSLNPDQRLVPASLSKLVLGAAALEKWGSTHQFQTRLFTAGQRSDAVLKGDLILEGAGDPSLTNEKLWFLCTDAARLGLREVRGDLILNTALFGNLEPPDPDRAAAAISSNHAYDGPLSAAAVNFSVLAVVIGPGSAPGRPAVIGLEPYPLETVSIVNETITTAAGEPSLTVSRRRNGGDVLTVSGQMPMGGFPVRIYRSVSQAEEYAGAVFKAFLAKAGVTVKGRVRVVRDPLPARAVPLAAVEGYPLDWQVRELFKVSNNFIADMLTLSLDLEETKLRGATWQGGTRRLAAYLQEVLRAGPWPVEPASGASEPVLASGSGLTPSSRLSARDLVAVLLHMYNTIDEFPAFLAALPSAGREGTLKPRFSTPATRHLQGRLRAKTGTLSEPLEAVGLAGYSRLQEGDWVAFAILVNGSPARPLGLANIRDAIEETLGRVLPP